MKRILIATVLVLCMLLSIAFAACSSTYVLTLYDNDGTTVLYTVKVSQGKAPEKPADPVKEGYEFVGWFITPTNPKEYDFSAVLTENAKAYARWKQSGYDDTRTWVMVGSGIGWDAEDAKRFTKVSGNVFELTIDINLGDEWKCTVLNADGKLDYVNADGANVGYALIKNPGEYFVAGNGMGDAPKNVLCSKAGNYTITLTSDPVNSNNSVSVKRNGDVIGNGDQEGTVTTFYIKGSKVTDWKDFVGPNNTLKETSTKGTYKLEIYLPQGEQFVFGSMVTVDGVTTPGTTLKYINLADENSKKLFEDKGDMVTKDSGTYTFTYVAESGVLSATLDKGKVPEKADYYIDGTFDSGLNWGNACFQDKYKFKQDSENPHIYVLEEVKLVENGEFTIRAFKQGSTEEGEWGKPTYNGLGTYQYNNVFELVDSFSAASQSNKNIKILKTSTYKISFNTYSNMIMIEDLEMPDDAYINGSMTGGGWKVDPDWKMTYNAEQKTYTLTKEFAVGNEFGIVVCINNSTVQRTFVGKNNVQGSPAGFDLSGHNIKCTTAGKYTIVVDMSGEKPVLTITSAK